MPTPLLHVTNLTKSYESREVLHELTFELNPGEVLALVGESGAGKSTLLQLLAGVSSPDAGTITLGDSDVASYAQKLVPGHPAVKLVAQDYRLFPHVSLRENIAYALREYNRDYQAFRVAELLDLADLSAVADRKPREVSGGEQQRAAIARAIAEQPRLLLLDEPFSHLDALHKQTLRQSLLALVRAEGIGCVFVTHDLLDALTTAERVGVMRQGQLLYLGTPREVLTQTENGYVKALMDSALSVVEAVERLRQSG